MNVVVAVTVVVPLPAVPVMVSVVLFPVPPADDDGVNVIVVAPLVVTLVGLKAAVTPVGNPLALNVTAPVKPFAGVTVILFVADTPPEQNMKKQIGGVTVTLLELADSPNEPFAAAATVNDCETFAAAE